MNKSIATVVAFFIGMGIMLVSCQKEQSIKINKYNRYQIKSLYKSNLSYREIGDMHNQALAIAYQASFENPKIEFKDHIKNLVRSVNNFSNFQGFDLAISTIDTITTKQGAADVLNKIKSDALKDPFIKMITDSVINIAIKINTVDEFDLKLNQFYLKNITKFSGDELIKFTNIIGVASGSFKYWFTNLDLWINLNIPGHVKNPPSASYLTKGQKWMLFGLSDMCSAWCVPLMVISSGLMAYSWD